MQFKVAQSLTQRDGCFLFFIPSQETLIRPELIWWNKGIGNLLQAAARELQLSICCLGRIRSFSYLLGKHVLPERMGLGKQTSGKCRASSVEYSPSSVRGEILSSWSNHLCIFLYPQFMFWFQYKRTEGQNVLDVQSSNLKGSSFQFWTLISVTSASTRKQTHFLFSLWCLRWHDTRMMDYVMI